MKKERKKNEKKEKQKLSVKINKKKRKKEKKKQTIIGTVKKVKTNYYFTKQIQMCDKEKNEKKCIEKKV